LVARNGYLLAAASGIVALVSLGQLPGDSRLSMALQNGAHAPAFFALSLIVLSLVRRFRRPYAMTFLLCVLLGAGIEILQARIGGDGQLGDLLTDMVGTAAGLAGAAWAARHSLTRALVLLALVSIAAAPVVWAVSACVHRRAEFPTLAAFDSPLDLYFFKPQSPAPELLPGGGLRVRLPEDRWPGITLAEPEPDWSGYRNLILDFRNPQSDPLRLTIRVHDRRHDQQMSDRFNRRFVLPAHAAYRLKIALADIQAAPRNRRLDLSQVAGLIVFAAPESAGREFILERIRLE
jgi:VanZ family protein